jgi:feruloyl esterase
MFSVHSLTAIVVAGLATTAQTGPVNGFGARCEALAKNLRIDGYKGYKVNIAQYLPKNSVIDHEAEGLNETCGWDATPAPLPVNLCRLQLTVPTSKSSEVVMETWLPENWNGRTLSTGNGGLGGCISYGHMEYGTKYGFMAVGSNGGHSGQSGGAFFNQPEVLQDWAWRALYTSTVVGKAIARGFYGKSHKKAYYLGCSTGGRQGWRAVQSNPELFDGVIAGAPALDTPGITAWGGLTIQDIFNNVTGGALTHEDFIEVNKIILQQCDKIDGAADGILEDNRKCQPDFSAAECGPGNNGAWCLTKKQIESLDRLYSPFSLDGQIIHGGLLPGSEKDHSEPENVALLWGMLSDWMKFVVKEDINYDTNTFNKEDARLVLATNPYDVQGLQGDLSKFRNRGGKVIHWHGQNDETLSITTSDRYYDHVSKTMMASPEELDRFYRYFRVSGVNHCNGGVGASNLGHEWNSDVSDDPNDNVLLRITEWVEKGRAPEIMRGHKYVNGNKSEGIEFSRKHCKHPKVNKYFGKGDGKDEEGWRCVHKY